MTTRPSLRTHATPGVRVFDVTSHRVYRIVDMTDDDRSVLLRGRDGIRYRVSYGDLVRGYRLVQPF